MNRQRRNWLALSAIGLLLVALGGVAGWWLAMRAMPMDAMYSRQSVDEGSAMGGMSDMQGMAGGEGMSGMEGIEGGQRGMERGPRGTRTVRVDPIRLQRIGVTYAVARREPLARTVRAEASVAYNEERKAYVSTKITGWVDRLYVDKPGQPVRRGQPLLEIYSPELVSTQRELVLALEHAQRSDAGPGSEEGSGRAEHEAADTILSARSLVESARRRLELWDVPGTEIERLIRTRDVRRTLPLSSPVSGVVVEKQVLQGTRVEPGENLYLIADLSTVWVEARVFETDLADIKVGQPAAITVQAYPNEEFPGRVSFIYPYLEPATRTVRVRLEVPNPFGRLKPGMFANVSFEVSTDEPVIVVPSSAVVETGERAFVLVKRGEGLFEPREVKVGERAGDEIAVAENLAAGETVVQSANFLIDSEANLMAYMGGMLGMGMRADQMRMEMEGMEEMKDMEDMTNPPAGEGGRPQER